MPAIEIMPIPDIYVDGIATVEHLPGGNVRLSYFAFQRGQKVIVAKHVRPLASINTAALDAMIKNTQSSGYNNGLPLN